MASRTAQEKVDDGLRVRRLSGRAWKGSEAFARSVRQSLFPAGLVYNLFGFELVGFRLVEEE